MIVRKARNINVGLGVKFSPQTQIFSSPLISSLTFLPSLLFSLLLLYSLSPTAQHITDHVSRVLCSMYSVYHVYHTTQQRTGYLRARVCPQ